MRGRLSAEGRTSADAGYALVDMVASLAVLAVVVALLPAALKHVQRALSTGTELSSRTSTTDALFLIEGRLREALAIKEPGRDGSLGLAFRGDPETLVFVAPTPLGSEGNGLGRFLVVVEPDGLHREQHRLVLRGGRYNGSHPHDETGLTTEVLVALPGPAYFLYFGSLEDGSARGWHSQWSRTDRLPDFIALEANSPPSAVRSKILTVAPRLGPLRWPREIVND